MDVIDLYCGAGGFSLGFLQEGFNVVLGVDIWKEALVTYAWNIEAEVLQADVRELTANDLPNCDVLIGSPPCPEFSPLRYFDPEKRYKKPDLSCIEAFMRLKDELNPKVWIWENVPYAIEFFPTLPHLILNSQNYGTPQDRKRVFVGNYPSPKRVLVNEPVGPTIVAQELGGGVDDRTRSFTQWFGKKPTISDLKHYMGFPENYDFTGSKLDKGRQLGNAVTPHTSRALARAIKDNPPGTYTVPRQSNFL